jgi:hypothetical protein
MADAPAAPVDPAARRLALAAALLALLAGALLLSFWVATQNFRIADFARTPKARDVLSAIEGDEARTMAARWFASESNRAMFSVLGWFQVAATGLAALLAYGAAAGRPRARAIRPLLILSLALAVALAPLVPVLVAKGRAIDFVSRIPEKPPAVREFLAWHITYSVADTVLVVLALLLVILLGSAAATPRTGGSK